MREGFRQAMAWLHTWLGLTFGWLLFAMFLSGTLSYFKEELNHWAHPEVPVRALDTRTALGHAEAFLQQTAPRAENWYVMPPNERQAALEVMWKQGDRFISKLLDPATGQVVDARESRGGDFFYGFHYELQLGYPFGRWVASFAALAMLVTLISGIITHKKLFKEFFTFRPGKGQRSWLDGHNAVGVLILPFHLMITYSGLVIFMVMLLPAPLLTAYKGAPANFYTDVFPNAFPGPAQGEPAQSAGLPRLYDAAIGQWPGARFDRVEVQNPGDKAARVVFYPDGAARIAYLPGASLAFDGVTGQPLATTTVSGGALLIGGGFYGLHMGQFASPVERWLYFIFGLGGTTMIGTGLMLWLTKRQLKHAREPRPPVGLRLVAALNQASMAGLLLAVAGYLCANRLLPPHLADRSAWEVRVFFLTWLAALVHAALRHSRRGWVEQLTTAAALYLALPLLGLFTTPRGLPQAIAERDWASAGVDLTAILCALVLAWLARKLARRQAVPVTTARPARVAS
ncbi:PepSY-associated TM helix domain-containing protein [Pseudomonas sp. RIT-PI-S]|uniref:PepSY-associated TM helix domain-containing protein n=1 Tax=Pseudomonas sp. RIT-PI-S TaxID=3035295 RepID=UPI0021D8D2E0|nr:PepSY-associated TM helix domain-containing protein [Pseudomonas sp. RIT-PI-S]